VQGLVELVHESLSMCPLSRLRELYRNIVLVGGSSRIEGLSERLQADLNATMPALPPAPASSKPGPAVQVVCDPASKYFTWIGGSILASLSTFQKGLIVCHVVPPTAPRVVPSPDADRRRCCVLLCSA
jgi:actin, other eukaryote